MNKIFSIFIFLIFLFNYVIKLSANDETYINSSNIIYNEKKNIVELAENSKINFKDTNILIDRGVIDYNKNEIEVFGNFYLYQELNILSGENLIGNTTLDSFNANNVSFIYNDDLKIDSDNIKRENNEVYFYNNFLTPCELDGYFNCPTWSLRIDKTKYEIEQDKFTHFDTFLQIADYKVFYLPYFSHYGAKAPRKKGFLTPTIEFSFGGDQSLVTPYYIPIGISSEVTLKPKISLSQNFELYENFELSTSIINKSSGGNTFIDIDSIKYPNNQNIHNTFKISTKQVLNKNNIISASALFTNSVSTTRSNNEESITFEDIYLRNERYGLVSDDDYLKAEISSVESFDSSNINLIPVSPTINYINVKKFNNFQNFNDLSFIILKRDESKVDTPSESLKLNLKSEFYKANYYKNSYIYSKIIIDNNFSDYYFNLNPEKNNNSIKSSIIFSSDVYNKFHDDLTLRFKIVLPSQITNTNKLINEDSQSLTFNYQNSYSENRFFGSDRLDNSPRLIYGIENELNIFSNSVSYKINQYYDFNKNNSFYDELNQKSNFSDYALEATTKLQNLNFKIDSRFDQKNLSKKEMNYSLKIKNPLDISVNFHETQSEAFKRLSNDTQSLNFNIKKNIYKNLSMEYSSNLDVKNNYDPYSSKLYLSIFDECSELLISYTNTRFNDNFNTKPEEIIAFTYKMDYLGFFGYSQTTDLFFKKPGEWSHGF